MKYYITPIAKLARYNIKIIFGNKFMYFILSAVGFYILTVGLNLISDSEITMATGYSMLLVPSILLIFYPTCFGIQNDQDAKIIEIIFGIPNYRYKMWLFRLLIACNSLCKVWYLRFSSVYCVLCSVHSSGMATVRQ